MRFLTGTAIDPQNGQLKVKVADKLNRLRLGVVLDTRTDENGATEYYVHYEGQDRRLDEWVGSSRVKRKITDKVKFKAEEKRKTPKKERRSLRTPLSNSGPINFEEVISRQHEEITKVKYIETVRYGNHEIDTWYFSPYPDDYGKTRYLYVCDRCMLYMKSETSYRKHLDECKSNFPGTEIYSESDFSIFEVCGKKDKFFCQCLCLFAKFFLDDKTIYCATDTFTFYVLCVRLDDSFRVAGFFSKEKNVPGINLNCLLVLPQYQRRGFGKLLIQLSYEISRREQVIGSPEKPLSDMGLDSYLSFWSYSIVQYMKEQMERAPTTIEELSQLTHISKNDLYSALEWMGLAEAKNRPFYGEIHFTFQNLKDLNQTKAKPPRLILNSRRLRWTKK